MTSRQIRDSAGNWHDVEELVNPEQGGEQTIRQIGPLAVPFDHADIDGNFGVIRLAELAANTVVLRAWARLVTTFNGGTIKFHVQVSDTPDGANLILNLVQYVISNSGDLTEDEAWQEILSSGWASDTKPTFYVGGVGPEGGWLTGFLNTGGGTPTAGLVHVYALIAEPAA